MACDFETMGAHIRNAIGPYVHIVALIEQMKECEKNGDINMYEKLKIVLYKSTDNIQHLIDISHMPEIEAINWRATDLCKKYYQEIGS